MAAKRSRLDTNRCHCSLKLSSKALSVKVPATVSRGPQAASLFCLPFAVYGEEISGSYSHDKVAETENSLFSMGPTAGPSTPLSGQTSRDLAAKLNG